MLSFEEFTASRRRAAASQLQPVTAEVPPAVPATAPPVPPSTTASAGGGGSDGKSSARAATTIVHPLLSDWLAWFMIVLVLHDITAGIYLGYFELRQGGTTKPPEVLSVFRSVLRATSSLSLTAASLEALARLVFAPRFGLSWRRVADTALVAGIVAAVVQFNTRGRRQGSSALRTTSGDFRLSLNLCPRTRARCNTMSR